MKKFVIFGTFFQIQEGEPHVHSGICGALYNSRPAKAGELKCIPFAGFIIADDNFGVFEGEINDEYGKASIVGTRKVGDVTTMYFEKKYIGLQATPTNYTLVKDGYVYSGHFVVEGAPPESNGWATCAVVQLNEELFLPEKFMEEIKTERARRNQD